jgi:hypothetical protein
MENYTMSNNPELDPMVVETEQPQPQQVPNVTLEVNINELNIIMSGLQELPHRVVDQVIRKVLAQAQAQLQPPS